MDDGDHHKALHLPSSLIHTTKSNKLLVVRVSVFIVKIIANLSESSSFSFTFHKRQGISLFNWAHNVSDQLSGLAIVGVDKLDSNLSDTTSGTY
jgi:hypothetical protein